uniref:Uncharacterized protein n=1 Tax=Anguilla anguilla TaxID=7936 RepID=A0A0E9TJV2_ANGAN
MHVATFNSTDLAPQDWMTGQRTHYCKNPPKFKTTTMYYGLKNRPKETGK